MAVDIITEQPAIMLEGGRYIFVAHIGLNDLGIAIAKDQQAAIGMAQMAELIPGIEFLSVPATFSIELEKPLGFQKRSSLDENMGRN